jgi:hypothetical protein
VEWRVIEVEGKSKRANRIFPFSKPSPFSSITDWPLGQPTNNDKNPPTNVFNHKKAEKYAERASNAPQNQRRTHRVQKDSR